MLILAPKYSLNTNGRKMKATEFKLNKTKSSHTKDPFLNI